jgi:tetratricopeptide (TPR) repeat protein
MKLISYRWAAFIATAVLLLTSACGEVRGRRLLQKANVLYRNGEYQKAVELFNEAEKLVPNLWLLWLNKGYTCRNILVPGGSGPENDAAVKCALDSFKRLTELKPDDKRGPALYVQTLFDSDQFETLAKMYLERFQKNPGDEEALVGLIQVYSKWPDHLQDALEWQKKRAELRQDDAEIRYAIGVYIWQQLFAKGGGKEKSAFDPRQDPNARKKKPKLSPPWAATDIQGQQRVDLADEGINYLEKAVEIRPKYHEAMAYINLLYRQKSFAFFDKPDEWQIAVDKATEWLNKTNEAMGKPTPKPGEEGEADGEEEAGGKTNPAVAGEEKQGKDSKKKTRKARKKK